MAILISVPGSANITGLRTAIGNWLHRADYLTFVDDLITVAEKWIFRNVRIREMEEALNVIIAGGVAAMPTNYIALKYAYIDSNPVQKLVRKGADWIIESYPDRATTSSYPRFIASDKTDFIFGPVPVDGRYLKGTYYKRQETVVTSTNDIISNHFDLYLFACLAEAAPYIRDDARVQMWESKRDRILADLNGESYREKFSGNTLQVSAA